jgi:hypothetical protein
MATFSRSDFKVGQKVYFGRRNGEKTLGEILKLNPTKAKVKTLEARGVVRERDAGVIWTVPYGLMTPADPNAVPGPTPAAAAVEVAFKKPEPLTFSPFAGSDNLILEAILDCYSGLSPENLCMDGEASLSHITRTRNELNRKLNGLFLALGRNVDEGEIYDWYRQKTDYERARQAKQA